MDTRNSYVYIHVNVSHGVELAGTRTSLGYAYDMRMYRAMTQPPCNLQQGDDPRSAAREASPRSLERGNAPGLSGRVLDEIER